jgi:hypothetical protein
MPPLPPSSGVVGGVVVVSVVVVGSELVSVVVSVDSVDSVLVPEVVVSVGGVLDSEVAEEELEPPPLSLPAITITAISRPRGP